MITIGEHPEGYVLSVRAQPNARKPGIVGEHNGALKIAVAVPPEDGRANKALIELLCEVLHLRRSQVELLSGEKSRDKHLLIRGLATHDLTARLAAFLE